MAKSPGQDDWSDEFEDREGPRAPFGDDDLDDYDLDDHDYPDDDEMFADEMPDLIPCPECGTEVYEDSERCPVCGVYIVYGSPSLWAGRPAWWVALGLLGIIATILTLSLLAI